MQAAEGGIHEFFGDFPHELPFRSEKKVPLDMAGFQRNAVGVLTHRGM
jgi:hypothetical protein